MSNPTGMPNALVSRAAIHQRLVALARQSELQRFTRTLAALEALHSNELHGAQRASQQAVMQSDTALSQLAALRHTAGAKEAKLGCQIAELQSQAQRRERLLAEREKECMEATARAVDAEHRARSSEATLSIELRRVESAQAEAARLLHDFAQAHEIKAQHLGDLQEQTARSTTLLISMQEQAAKLQKRFTQQQRRSMRLQESQHVLDATQRTWGQERKQLIEAAETAALAAREATARQHHLEAAHAALVREVEAEREHSLHTLRHHREVASSTETSLRGELRGLQTLFAALEHDSTRVALKNGGAMSIAQYVRSLGERQQRSRTTSASAAGRAQRQVPPQQPAADADDHPAPRAYLRAEPDDAGPPNAAAGPGRAPSAS